MARTPSVIVDGVDLRDVGLILEVPVGWRDATALIRRMSDVPGKLRQMLLNNEPEVRARAITLNGTIRATTAAARNVILDELNYRMSSDTGFELKFADQTDRFLTAFLEGGRVRAVGPALSNPYFRIAFTLICPDPLIREVADTVVGSITTTPTETPLGSAPSLPVLTITSGAVDPIIVYKNAAGATITTMDFTGLTLAAVLTIDNDAKTIKEGATNRIDDLVGDFIRLDPRDGAAFDTVPTFPTLEVSAGTLEATYQKAFL